MRNSKAFIGILCPLLILTSGASAPDVVARVDACTAATDVVAKMILEEEGRKVVFTDEYELLLRPVGNFSDWYQEGSRTPVNEPPPPATLVAKLNQAGTRSAVKVCRSVREFLDKRGIAHGKAAVKKATDPKRKSDGIYAESVLGLSTPVISDGGMDALVLTSSASGFTAAGGLVRHLRRNENGDWIQVGYRGLWVS